MTDRMARHCERVPDIADGPADCVFFEITFEIILQSCSLSFLRSSSSVKDLGCPYKSFQHEGNRVLLLKMTVKEEPNVQVELINLSMRVT